MKKSLFVVCISSITACGGGGSSSGNVSAGAEKIVLLLPLQAVSHPPL